MKSANVEEFADGEAQLENIPCYEVDRRRKDLLPVFDHFNSINQAGMTEHILPEKILVNLVNVERRTVMKLSSVFQSQHLLAPLKARMEDHPEGLRTCLILIQ
ncbi:hypothetical protein R6Q59_026198 [Mikania micrantha]